jgi:outer membrane protein OmpA-like peptidoglycan-associated protein
MKNLSLYIVAILLASPAMAQNSSDSTVNRARMQSIKDKNEALPLWAIDASYRYGGLQQQITMMDIAAGYPNSLNAGISDVEFSDGSSHGANLQLVRFFGKKDRFEGKRNRRWGVGLGINWFAQKGTMTMNAFNIEYRSQDSLGSTFRQRLTSNGPVVEEVRISNFTIPLTLKYKHQFPKSNLGFAVDAGAFLGISAAHKYDARANFNYEAIYMFDGGGNYVYDDNAAVDPSSQLITRDFWLAHQTSDESAEAYFVRKRKEGMNVGLNERVTGTGTSEYTKMSWGWMLSPSLTYYVSHNVTFVVGPYFMMQYFANDNNPSYRLTDKVGAYSSMVGGIAKNQFSSIGFNVGFRFFMGEKRDVDGDRVIDKEDLCPEQSGDTSFFGCPDSDGDKIKDSEDECPNEFGHTSANGCRDTDGDGIKDSEDKCANKYGMRSLDPSTQHLNGCPPEQHLRAFAESKNLVITEKNIEQAQTTFAQYFDTLKTDVLHFDTKKADIPEKDYFALDQAADILSKNPEVIIFISGHTDSTGSYKDNMKLSFDRAEAVSKYLQSKGVTAERIITSGYGSGNPFTSNRTEEERALNRRTEMRLLLPVKPKK